MSKILIVEDNDRLLSLIRDRVQEKGWKPVCCDHFEDAIQALDYDRSTNSNPEDRFAVAIVDLARDETIGTDEAWTPGQKVIANATADQFIKVIVYTALEEGDAAVAIAPWQVYRYLRKEKSLDLLIDLTGHVIQERKKHLHVEKTIELVSRKISEIPSSTDLNELQSNLAELVFELRMRLRELAANKGETEAEI